MVKNDVFSLKMHEKEPFLTLFDIPLLRNEPFNLLDTGL